MRRLTHQVYRRTKVRVVPSSAVTPTAMYASEEGEDEGSEESKSTNVRWWEMFGRSISGTSSDSSSSELEVEDSSSNPLDFQDSQDDEIGGNNVESFLPPSISSLLEFKLPSFASTPLPEDKLNTVREMRVQKSEERELKRRRKSEARAMEVLERERRAREELESRQKEREEYRRREERTREVEAFKRGLRSGIGLGEEGNAKKGGGGIFAKDDKGVGEEEGDKNEIGSNNGMPSWVPNFSTPAFLQFSGDKGGKWVDLIPKTEISPGELVPVKLLGVDLLVVAPAPGVLPDGGSGRGKLNVYVIANSCPHLGTPLETGRITLSGTTSKTCITCPLHRSTFELETGESTGEWCPSPPFYGDLFGGGRKELGVFEVREKGRWLQVRIESDVVCLD